MLSYCVELSMRMSRGRDYCRAVCCCLLVFASKSVFLQRPPSWQGILLSMFICTILALAETSTVNRSSLLSLIVSHFSERPFSGVPRGSRLQSLDSELGVLENASRVARRIRNMQTGPGSLPQEVLSHVFEYLQTLWFPRREYSRDKAKTVFCAGWMSVTHVCSFWREVRLLSPVS